MRLFDPTEGRILLNGRDIREIDYRQYLHLFSTVFQDFRFFAFRYKLYEEDGIELSGGESQKLAIARALYKDAPVVVLDEPTAALDPRAEYEMYTRLFDMVKDKTSVFINLSPGMAMSEDRKSLSMACKSLADKGVIIVSAFDNAGSLSSPDPLNFPR
jgi:ABC-type multidrug transport system fused ATPase/permease subunit